MTENSQDALQRSVDWDAITHEAADWRFNPFSGEIADGLCMAAAPSI
jgi:hypothetical protein